MAWLDADPTDLTVLESEEANYTLADPLLIGTDGDQIQLLPNKFNATINASHLYDCSVLQTADGWTLGGSHGTDSVAAGILSVTTTSGQAGHFSQSFTLSNTNGTSVFMRVKINDNDINLNNLVIIQDGTKRQDIRVKKDGSDLVFDLLYDSSGAYTATGKLGAWVDIWFSLKSGTSALYVDGVQRVTGTGNADATSGTMTVGPTATAVSDIDYDQISIWNGDQAAPEYEKTATTVDTPSVADADLTSGTVGNWGTATITAGSVGGTGGTTRVRGYDGTTYTSWTTVSGTSATVDVSALDPTGSLSFQTELLSTDGTGTPRPVTKFSVDWSTDSTPPGQPTLSSVGVDGNLGAVAVEWTEPADGDFSHVNVNISFDNTATWLVVNDQLGYTASGTAMKFNNSQSAQQAAGWINDRGFLVRRDASGELVTKDQVRIRVQSEDTNQNKSGWVLGTNVIVGAATDVPQGHYGNKKGHY